MIPLRNSYEALFVAYLKIR